MLEAIIVSVVHPLLATVSVFAPILIPLVGQLGKQIVY